MKRRLLVATNGFEGSWPAIAYSAWLAKLLELPISLIGVTEPRQRPNIDDEMHPLEAMFSRAVALFQESSLDYQLELHEGHAEEIISNRVCEDDCLAVLGPLGRPPMQRLLQRRSFHQFMADIPSPILYVPQACLPPKRILICLGGLGYGLTVEHLGLEIAEKAGASITLLHVVPPIDLDYPEARTVREKWEHLEDTDTLLGGNLRAGLEMAKNANLETSLKVRQGKVIEEILAELKEGDYQLICMGSPYSAWGLRHYYTPNVTAEVAEAVRCPVLTARAES
ncbi:MAG: hypothetical protein Kow002_05910 [Anaerolineales bacterium]